jgi:uncharacterized protein (TIGR01244 family)
MPKLTISLILLLLWAVGSQAADLPVKLDPAGFEKVLSQSGSTLIAGQPTPAGLLRAKQAGVTAVISLRTEKEMKELPFDEAAQVQADGLQYYNIPLGDDDSFAPAAVQQFIDLYTLHDGKVLLHCRSARRASYMWTAFLVKHEGMDLASAQQQAAAINLGTSPIEGLLGKKLHLEYVDKGAQ